MPAASHLLGLGLALLSLAFLMPGHYLPWASFQNQWIAAFGAALVVLAASGEVARRGHRVPIQPLAALACLSAFVPLTQWAAGQLPFASDAILSSAYLFAFGLTIVAGTIWARIDRSAWLDLLFAMLTTAAGISVALAMLQWLSIEASQLWAAPAPPGARPFANLGQPNHLALLLCLGLVGTWRARARGHLGAVVAGLLTGWLGFGLVMTQSRTGWLIVALLVLWCLSMRRRAQLGVSAATVVIGASAFALAVTSWDALNEALRLTQYISLSERMQGGTRPRLWHALLEAIARSPWVGYGFNQASLAQQAVAVDMTAVQEMAESAHNIVLDLAIWFGLPGMLIWLGVVTAWFTVRIRGCRASDDWFVLAACGTVLTHAMLEYPLEHAYFLLPLGLLMGSIVRPPRQASPRLKAWALAIPTVALTALLFLVGVEYLRVEQASHRVRLALFGVGDPAAPEAAPPDVRLLDAPREYHRLMLTPSREGMSVEELDWMRTVTQRHAFPPAMLRYALAAGLNGRTDEAAITLRRLCSMHSPLRCEESRSAWKAAQQQWPALAAVPPP